MKRLSLRILATAAVAAAVFASVGIAAAAPAPTRQTATLIGPLFEPMCNTSAPLPANFADDGSVTFDRTSPTALTATVRLKGALPNTLYSVFLFHGTILANGVISCPDTFVNSLTTNANGVANGTFDIPISAGDFLFSLTNVNASFTNFISTPTQTIPSP